MLKVKIGDIEFDVPQDWHEVKFSNLYKFMQLENLRSFQILQAICGLSDDVINKMRIADLLPLEASLHEWINEAIDFSTSYAPILFFRNKQYQLPEDIGAMPIGIYKDLQSEISALGPEPTNLKVMALYPIIVASYLQPMLNGGEYDYLEAEKLKTEIAENCEGVGVIAFGNFFLAKLIYLKSGSTHLSQNQNLTNIAKFRNKQGSTIWRKISGLLTHLKSWYLKHWSLTQSESAK